METGDRLTDDDLYTCDTSNYALVAIVVIGLPLVVALLYKIHVDQQHKKEKEEAYREIMEEYQTAKSSQAAGLRREVIETRMESETQKMRLEENEQTLRQRHKQEISELEIKRREYEIELEALQRKIDREKQDHTEKEERSQTRLKQLEWELVSLRSETKESQLRLEEHCQSRVQKEVKAYQELSDEFNVEVRKRDKAIAALKKEKAQLEDELFAKDRENGKLQNDLKHQEAMLKSLQDEVGKRKQPKKESRAKRNTDMPSTNDTMSHSNPSSHASVYSTQ